MNYVIKKLQRVKANLELASGFHLNEDCSVKTNCVLLILERVWHSVCSASVHAYGLFVPSIEEKLLCLWLNSKPRIKLLITHQFRLVNVEIRFEKYYCLMYSLPKIRKQYQIRV